MLLGVAIISVALAIFILKYVLSSSGPNPFETDTREPLKKMVHDRKEKKKVLKQGDFARRSCLERCIEINCFALMLSNVGKA